MMALICTQNWIKCKSIQVPDVVYFAESYKEDDADKLRNSNHS